MAAEDERLDILENFGEALTFVTTSTCGETMDAVGRLVCEEGVSAGPKDPSNLEMMPEAYLECPLVAVRVALDIVAIDGTE